MIAARQIFLGRRAGGAKLPYDAEVEYLESTGTQWIDTGYNFNSSTDVVGLDFELLTTTPQYKWIFGAYDTKRLAIGSGDRPGFRTFGYNVSTSYNLDKYYTDGRHIYFADTSGAGIDGTSFAAFSDFSTTSNIFLFTIPLDLSVYCSKSRIWSYKHYRDGALISDFQPVRFTNELGQSEGAMYDRVSWRLFRNAGTGAFLYGPDKIPIETDRYVQDGLVAMWDGKENAGVGLHDANATQWVDLVSGKKSSIISATAHDAYIYFSTTNKITEFDLSQIDVLYAESVWAIDGPTYNYNPFVSIQKNGAKCVGGMRRKEDNALTWANVKKPLIGGEYGVIHCTSGYLGGSNGFYLNGDWEGTTLVDGWGRYSKENYLQIRQGDTWGSSGRVYSIRLYSRALTATEVSANCAVDKQRFNLP